MGAVPNGPIHKQGGWACHQDFLLEETPLTLIGFIMSMTANLYNQFGMFLMQSMLQYCWKLLSQIEATSCIRSQEKVNSAIDCVLVWIHKPTKWDVKQQGFGNMKCYCGCKTKYGLNTKAICDLMGQLLDITIAFPGAFSNYCAFNFSKIKEKLEMEELLHPGQEVNSSLLRSLIVSSIPVWFPTRSKSYTQRATTTTPLFVRVVIRHGSGYPPLKSNFYKTEKTSCSIECCVEGNVRHHHHVPACEPYRSLLRSH